MFRHILSACGVGVVVLSAIGCGAKVNPVDTEMLSAAHRSYGAQLTHGLAACGFCHGAKSEPGAPLTGGRTVVDAYGEVPAPNLTGLPEGIGAWKASEVERVMRGGKREDESRSWNAHRGYEWMSDEDLLSIVAYIKSLKPAGEYVTPRSIGFIARNTTGWDDMRREVKGAVPEVSRRDSEARGQYLVDHVARCGYCHSTPSTFFSSEKYLEGGNKVIVEGSERIAPDITARSVSGIGSWTVGQIAKYLATGVTPSNEIRGGVFCPTNFYRHAPAEDLIAIATYLRTVE